MPSNPDSEIFPETENGRAAIGDDRLYTHALAAEHDAVVREHVDANGLRQHRRPLELVFFRFQAVVDFRTCGVVEAERAELRAQGSDGDEA